MHYHHASGDAIFVSEYLYRARRQSRANRAQHMRHRRASNNLPAYNLSGHASRPHRACRAADSTLPMRAGPTRHDTGSEISPYLTSRKCGEESDASERKKW